MYRISADQILNRLIITLSGTIKKNEVEKIYELVHTEVALLNRNFSVITNISAFKSLEIVSKDILSKFSDLLKSKGCGKIVRVVGASKEGLLTFHHNTNHIKNYNVSYVASMEDALKLLKIY